MNIDALFSDGTGDYVIPPEPNKNQWIKIRFRTAKDDVDYVMVVTSEKNHKMEKVDSSKLFDYYQTELRTNSSLLRYYFSVHKGDESVYYNQLGASREIEDYYQFRISPGFSTPDWAKGAVMYQIFVDRFYNGDSSNDVEDYEYIYIGEPCKKVMDWHEPPAAMDVRRFYGGDLAGVLKKLDYLQELGIQVVYFNPLFVSPSNHKYDTQDYDYIDPHYGVIVEEGGEVLLDGADSNLEATKYQKRTGDYRNLKASNELFGQLVSEMHKRGMKVIIDGVFNHCGSFNKWMDRERIYEEFGNYKKGAYISADSEFRNFFRFHKEEDEDWPYNDSYDGWWGHDTLPKLNYESSPYLRKHIFHIARKWLLPGLDADGWRLDVAADLGHSKEYNHKFWKMFRNEVKSAKENALIVAEHYGDSTDWLQGDEWDTIMNYDAFMEPISWFLTGVDKHSDSRRDDLKGNAEAFVNSITRSMTMMMTPSLQVAMNQLSNHDHSRFLTRTNQKTGRVGDLGHYAAEEGVSYSIMREGVIFQMTWVGAPAVYYGDEAGLCGFTDPDNRRTYPWGKENHDLIDFHKIMIKIRKGSEALKIGSTKILTYGNGAVSYARFNMKEQYIIALNNINEPKELTIPVWITGLPMDGVMKRLMYSYDGGYTGDVEKVYINNGEIVISMGAYSAIVLKSASEEEFNNQFWR